MARRLRSDSGLSLAELLVTIMILSIVSVMVTGTFISLQRTVAQSSQRFDDLGQARLALDATTKSLRTAVRLRPGQSPFTIARENDVEFYANLDLQPGEEPQRVRLQLVNGELVETMTRGQMVEDPLTGDLVWNPQDGQAGQPRQRVIARDIVGDAPLFTYFQQGDLDPLAMGDGNDPTAPSDQLSQDNQRAVRYVRIRVAVRSTEAFDVPPTEASNRIHMPNLFFVQEL